SRTAPTAATVREVKPFAPPARPAAPAPKEPAAPNLPAPASPATSQASGAESLKISLTAIVGLFPKDIPGVANPAMIDGVKINIPLSRVIQQLPQGSAKISFGELRRVSPPGAFRCSTDADAKLIDLPLSEILPQLNATQFTRRSGQKRVEVPDEVTGIFSS